MDCPIYLEKLTNSVTFTCGHACCLLCLQASEIKVCPLCRKQITTWSPTPWLDFQRQDFQRQDFQEEHQNQSLENYYFNKPTVDPRGDALRQAYVEFNSLRIPIVSEVLALVNKYQKLADEENRKYQEQLQTLEANHQKDLKIIEKQLQKEIQKEETRVKGQEYHNQSLTHLATTMLALSIQTSEVLDQAIPVYESKLDSLPSRWPWGISPLRQNGVKPKGKHFVYVHVKNDFVYERDGYIIMGERKSNIRGELPVVRIKCSATAIYVLRTVRMFVYDLELNLIDNFSCSYANDFYLDGDTPIMCTVSGSKSITTLNGVKIKLDHGWDCKIDNIEYLNGQLYIYDEAYNRTKVYILESDDLNTEVAITIVEATTGNFFVSQGKVYYYIVGRKTVIFLPNNNEIAMPGKCRIYPGRKNTVLCENTNGLTLVEL